MKAKNKIMEKIDIMRSLKRIAHEIVEFNKGTDSLIILGIRRRGVPLGKLINEEIKKTEGKSAPFGILDITLYRDDLSTLGEKPKVNSTEINFDINDKNIVLIDDVLYTGRTIRSAIDEIMDFGRPASVQVAVLIDRGHRELPIFANYIGRTIPTKKSEIIKVMTEETDGKWEVWIYEKLDK
ncbi:bifunctional pyr operon transcriptional regulator/uracil phosphoribosyltransferase PyrR [bacterium]|nr:bifunctional pyr operon transcriptional regulator/uracil phosphoribosyltransferase PyrR [bacterium]